MCRPASQGGRRCPHCSSQAAKKAAAQRRKNNRKAKKNLVSFFQDKGMNETAEALKDIKPSQIPDFLGSTGTPEDALGEVSIPHANVHKDDRTASDIVAVALQEAQDKGIPLSDVAETMVEQGKNTHPTVSREEVIAQLSTIAQSHGIDVVSLGGWDRELALLSDEELQERNKAISDVYNVISSMDYDEELSDVKEWSLFLNTMMNKVNPDFPQYKVDDFISNSINAEYITPDNVDDVDPDESAKKGILSLRNNKEFLKHRMQLFESIAVTHNDGMDMRIADNIFRVAHAESVSCYTVGESCYMIMTKDRTGDYMSQYAYAPDGFENYHSVIMSSPLYAGREDQVDDDFSSIVQTGHVFIPRNFGFTQDTTEEEKRSLLIGDYSPQATFQRMHKIHQSGGDNVDMSYIPKNMTINGDDVKSKNNSVMFSQLRALHAAYLHSHGRSFISSLGSSTHSSMEHGGTGAQMVMSGVYPTGKNNGEKRNAERRKSARQIVRMKNDIGDEEEYDIENFSSAHYDSESDVVQDYLHDHVHEDDIEQLYDFTDNGYEPFSISSYGGVDSTGERKDKYSHEQISHLSDVIKTISENTVTEPRVVTRSTSKPSGMTVAQFAESMSKGDEVKMSKITSTSWDYYVSSTFGNHKPDERVIYVYNTKQGASIDSISGYKEEREVTLPAGATFVYDGYEKIDGVVHMFFSDK